MLDILTLTMLAGIVIGYLISRITEEEKICVDNWRRSKYTEE